MASFITQIQKLQAEIKQLQGQAVAELTQKRKAVKQDLTEIDSQLEQVEG